jgi:hypothetical protein
MSRFGTHIWLHRQRFICLMVDRQWFTKRSPWPNPIRSMPAFVDPTGTCPNLSIAVAWL